MLVLVCSAIILPLLIVIAFALRWLMPNSSLVARPAEPFRPRIWHLMILGLLVAGDYWMVNPDLSAHLPRMGVVPFAGDVAFFTGLPFLGRRRGLPTLGWSVAAWLLSVAVVIPVITYRLLVPPH